MQVINKRIDFFLIKFPIIFPIIYYLLITLFPNYEIYVIFLTILILAEPHFGATWPHFYKTFEKKYIFKNRIRLFYAPILIVIFCCIGFLFFKKIFFLIFFAANMYHVTRQSLGICKLYKKSDNQVSLDENLIYIFNILFFIIGFFRFFYPVIEGGSIFILNLTVIVLILVCVFYSGTKYGFKSNLFTLFSGIIIFYPLCFVDSPVHAILMGVTMHYSQYLTLIFKINDNKINHYSGAENKNKFFSKFLLIVVAYSIIMTGLSYFGKSDLEFIKLLILIPIIGQMLHFFIDSQIWKFSDSYIRENVLQYLFKK
jgi:hypothetical protein